MLVSNMPNATWNALCACLDADHKWVELAQIMLYDLKQILDLHRRTVGYFSTTDELLNLWCSDHTVLELFLLLSRMNHIEGMMILKDHVDENYHWVIDECRSNRAAKCGSLLRQCVDLSIYYIKFFVVVQRSIWTYFNSIRS